MKQLNFAFESESESKPQTDSNNPYPSRLYKGSNSQLKAVNTAWYQEDSQILHLILIDLINQYFPSRSDLLDYKITWSSRAQKRTLASCNLKARKILVAKELKHPDYRQYLQPLIYHELCHAVLGYSVHSKHGKSRWHGKEFRLLEKQHPQIKLLNQWIKDGGWRQAVRRHRGKMSSLSRTSRKKSKRISLISRFLKSLGIE